MNVDEKPDLGRAPQPRQPDQTLSFAGGQAVASAEAGVLDFGTNGICRFRIRHPFLYGLIAFIIGSGLIGIFTMTTYSDWTFSGINLKLAVYQVIFGSLGGGIVMVLLAFGYARTVKPAMGLGSAEGQRFSTLSR